MISPAIPPTPRPLGPKDSNADPMLWPKGKPAYVAEPPVPVARLPRPVLLVPGGKSIPYGLPDITHYLTAGGNNVFGGSYCIQDTGFEKTIPPGGNVFCLRYATPFGSFEHNADEIRQAVEDIKRFTHSPEIDVIASCKGALETRQYISEGEHGIRNLVLMVPPNHGLPVSGEIARVVGRISQKLHLPLHRAAGFPMNDDAYDALSSFVPDWRLGPLHGNRKIERLNAPENQDHESKTLHSITVLGGEGRRLLNGKLGPGLPFPIMRGDHLVPNWSAFLPHARNFFYDGDRSVHNRVKSHPEALAKLAEALTTDGAPAIDSHYQDKAPSVNHVALRSVAWVGAMSGRAVMAKHALSGTVPGPVGVALGVLGAGLAVLDGTRQMVDVVQGEHEGERAKAIIGSLGKFAQAAGVGAAFAGAGPVAAILIGGGLLASTLTD